MTALVGTPIAAATKMANQKGAFKMPEGMKEKSLEVVKQGIDALDDFAKKLVESGKDSVLATQLKEMTHGGKLNLSALASKGKNAEKLFQAEIKQKAPEISEKVVNAMKEQRILNNYSKTAKNVADKFFQPAFMPLRATITIAMVPVLLGLMGKKKPTSKSKEENMFNSLNYKVLQTPQDEKVFKSFSGVAKYENK